MNNSKEKISIRPGYVLIERPRDYEVVLSEQPGSLLEISAVCMDAGCQKVLILGPRTSVRLSVADIYDLGEKISELGLRIAIVESHNASDEEVKFLENVVSNRGAPIRFFGNKGDAEDWLGIT